MVEISPHQGTESQWIEALLFLPISDIPRCGRPRLHGNRSFFLGIYTFYLFPLFSRALSSREHLEIERAARK